MIIIIIICKSVFTIFVYPYQDSGLRKTMDFKVGNSQLCLQSNKQMALLVDCTS